MCCQSASGALLCAESACPRCTWRSPRPSTLVSTLKAVGSLRLARVVDKKARRQSLKAHPGVIATSDDQVLVFHLNARPGGISVQRKESRAGGGQVTQSVRFTDEASFTRWCESDALRFAYPLLFSKLTRSGCVLFNAAL